MKSFNDKLRSFSAAFEGVQRPIYHYWRMNQTDDKYAVWAEQGEPSSLSANNHKAEQAVEILFEYFTTEEFDETVDTLQEIFNGLEISWYLVNVEYDDSLGKIHYEWEIEI